MVGVIDAVVAGALGALIADALGAPLAFMVTAAVGAFFLTVVLMTVRHSNVSAIHARSRG